MLLDNFRREWNALSGQANRVLALELSRIVVANADTLARSFYEIMLKDSQASSFLDHEQVRLRLHASLVRWMNQLFAPDANALADDVYELQMRVGDAHARIDIPVSVVLKGGRALKSCFAAHLEGQGEGLDDFRFQANRLFCMKVDLAMEVMSQAYTVTTTRKARSSEAYRLFSITENLATEKERQKAALLDWESAVMFEAAMGRPSASLQRLRESEFGLWFRHKGMHAFQGVPEADVILRVMDLVDEHCLTELTRPDIETGRRAEIVREIRSHARNMQLQLASLFEHSLELESGKDVLTRLLNRKFLPTVLMREIEHSRKHDRAFAIAVIDIDHFKAVNDTHGHEAGDQVIQQVASVLAEQCRGGDFLFRMGGEEFLAVLVDLDVEQATLLCERMRQAIERHPFLIPDGTALALTVSIGMAAYCGHPDYNYLMRMSDEAVYEAKSRGRNQVVVRQAVAHGGAPSLALNSL